MLNRETHKERKTVKKCGMKKVIVSAPGKVIIHGEHAVVYGKVCVVKDLGSHDKQWVQYSPSCNPNPDSKTGP